MKLISLNTWGGKLFKPLISFIQENSQDTDIFCFQEIYDTESDVKDYHEIRANLLDEIIKILPHFRHFYSIEIKGVDSCPESVNFDLSVGKAIFVKDNIKADSEGDILFYGDRNEKFLKNDFSNLPLTLQYISFTIDDKETLLLHNKHFTLCNIHGTAFPASKLDTKLRLDHSNKIKDFLKNQHGAKILIGDFNLLPETQSIKILEEDLRNLIKEFNIERTRSNLSPFYGKPDFQKFADYAFVSPDIKVENFEVPKVEISDHLPLFLQFS